MQYIYQGHESPSFFANLLVKQGVDYVIPVTCLLDKLHSTYEYVGYRAERECVWAKKGLGALRNGNKKMCSCVRMLRVRISCARPKSNIFLPLKKVLNNAWFAIEQRGNAYFLVVFNLPIWRARNFIFDPYPNARLWSFSTDYDYRKQKSTKTPGSVHQVCFLKVGGKKSLLLFHCCQCQVIIRIEDSTYTTQFLKRQLSFFHWTCTLGGLIGRGIVLLLVPLLFLLQEKADRRRLLVIQQLDRRRLEKVTN